jgi:hypothetical protein
MKKTFIAIDDFLEQLFRNSIHSRGGKAESLRLVIPRVLCKRERGVLLPSHFLYDGEETGEGSSYRNSCLAL